MLRKPTIALALLSIVALLAAPRRSGAPNRQSDPIVLRIEPSTVAAPILQRWAYEYHKLHPNVTIQVGGNGAGRMRDVDAISLDRPLFNGELRERSEYFQ